eukprot:TRINITY_DN20625_c0_g1_i1.p1 TRINITY_DN20625_c0_g1~~TRINITY_DN20625_c0_g1_i1.p1  ORF type:complete len:747 (+),score=251.03 TRINITY_DN20625_c0_g1_i1:207-2447(+)
MVEEVANAPQAGVWSAQGRGAPEESASGAGDAVQVLHSDILGQLGSGPLLALPSPCACPPFGGAPPKPLDPSALSNHAASGGGSTPAAGAGATPAFSGGDTPPLLAGDSTSTTPLHGAVTGAEPAPPPGATQQQQDEAGDKGLERVLQIRAERERLAQQLLALQQQEEQMLASAGLGSSAAGQSAVGAPEASPGRGHQLNEAAPYAAAPGGAPRGGATPPPGGNAGLLVQPGQLISPEVAMQMTATGNWGVLWDQPPAAPQPPAPIHSRRGRYAAMARDGQGIRQLMRIIQEGSDQDVAEVFDDLMGALDLAADLSGSQVLLALFKRADEQQRTVFCERLATDLQHFAFNMHGTRLLQKIIETVGNHEQVQCIVQSVIYHAHSLIKDLNGNHIVQQCLQSFPPEVCQGIHDAVAPRVVEFGTHRHGCCVLQCCIECGDDAQKMALVAEVINNGLHLVQDPFGNYLLQYILEMDVDFVNVRVVRQFLGSIATLSTNKFASNVIEKCLKLAPDDVRQLICDEIGDPSRLGALLQDQYANYVVQTALAYANPQQFAQLSREITPMMHLIRNTPHGKRIETRLRQGGVDYRRLQYNRQQQSRQSAEHFPPWHQFGKQERPFGKQEHTFKQEPPHTGRAPPVQSWSDIPPPQPQQRIVKVLASGGTLLSEPPPSALPGQSATSPPRSAVAGGFRLNPSAVPFQAPNSPPGPGTAAPANTPDSLSPQRLPYEVPPQPQQPKAVHPALVFGAD